jgi:hypothetical protein
MLVYRLWGFELQSFSCLVVLICNVKEPSKVITKVPSGLHFALTHPL